MVANRSNLSNNQLLKQLKIFTVTICQKRQIAKCHLSSMKEIKKNFAFLQVTISR